MLKSFVKSHPQLTLASGLIVLLGLIAGIFYSLNTLRNADEKINIYGHTVTQAAAKQAVAASMQQDLISMQAVLVDIRQNPWIVGARIRNVEGKTLVETGTLNTQALQERHTLFSAPISVNQNIYGYIDLLVQSQRLEARDYQFLIIWLIAIFASLSIIWWSIQRQWWAQFKEKLPTASEVVTAVVEKVPVIEEDPEPEPEAPKLVSVRLSLQITNLNRLYDQLNSESFATVLRRFEKQMQSVVNLYEGHRQMLNGNVLLIDFTGESYEESCFRAVCCAHLLTNLAASNPSPRLHIASSVYELSEPLSTKQSLVKDFVVQHNIHLKPSKGEILISHRLIDEELQLYVDVAQDSGKFLGLRSPYAELVAKQEAQLINR
ncbi:MAG: hypothetical protein ACI4NJ_02895 [Cellvibrio sp.]